MTSMNDIIIIAQNRLETSRVMFRVSLHCCAQMADAVMTDLKDHSWLSVPASLWFPSSFAPVCFSHELKAGGRKRGAGPDESRDHCKRRRIMAPESPNSLVHQHIAVPTFRQRYSGVVITNEFLGRLHKEHCARRAAANRQTASAINAMDTNTQ